MDTGSAAIDAHDLPAGIDARRAGKRGSGHIDRGKSAVVEEKAVFGSASDVQANDLPTVIDPIGDGLRGARHIESC